MFSGCDKITEFDFSKFDTSQIKSMNSKFSRCKLLTSLDVSNFVTTQVESIIVCLVHVHH